MVSKRIQTPLRILLVEENENNVLAIRRQLQNAQLSCNITPCKCVEEALEYLHTDVSVYDLVMSDDNLPGRSGLEMFKDMQTTGMKIPFMLVMQPGTDARVVEAFEIGVDDCIVKDPKQKYLDRLPNKLTEVLHKFSDRIASERTTEELRKSDESFRAIFESMADRILVLDKNYNSIYANKPMREYISSISQDLKEIPDFIQSLKTRVDRVFSLGKLLQMVDAIPDKNDKMIHIESVFSPVRDSNGKIFAVGIVHRDITKQKHVEEELRKYKDDLEELVEERTAELKEANKNFRKEMAKRNLANIELEKSLSLINATLEATADGILVMDTNQNVVNFNQKFVKICDIPENILRSKDGNQILKYFLDQLPDPDDFLVMADEIANQPDAASFDIIDTKENRVFECYSHPQVIGEDIVGRVWSFRDITDRKRAQELLKINEKQYRSIFNSATNAYLIINLDWKIIEVNTNATELYGYSYYELVNMPIKNLIHSDYHNLIDQFKQNIQSINQFKGEIIGINKEGGKINLEFKGNLFDYKGRIHILAILTDITERKVLEQKLKRYNNHLKKVSKLINKLG